MTSLQTCDPVIFKLHPVLESKSKSHMFFFSFLFFSFLLFSFSNLTGQILVFFRQLSVQLDEMLGIHAAIILLSFKGFE